MSEPEVSNGSIGFYGEYPDSWSDEQKAAMRLIERGIVASTEIAPTDVRDDVGEGEP